MYFNKWINKKYIQVISFSIWLTKKYMGHPGSVHLCTVQQTGFDSSQQPLAACCPPSLLPFLYLKLSYPVKAKKPRNNDTY